MSDDVSKMTPPRVCAIKHKHGSRGRWRCIFGRPGQPTAFIEELADGWHLIVAGKDVGTTASDEAAVQLARKINREERGRN